MTLKESSTVSPAEYDGRKKIEWVACVFDSSLGFASHWARADLLLFSSLHFTYSPVIDRNIHTISSPKNGAVLYCTVRR